jgi:hypothetical protein
MAPRCQVDPSDSIHRDSQGVNIYSFSAVAVVTPKNRQLPFYTIQFLLCANIILSTLSVASSETGRPLSFSSGYTFFSHATPKFQATTNAHFSM